MSDCESISGSEIPDANEFDSSSNSDEEYCPKTIPLNSCHPLFRQCGDFIITEQNRKIFIQTPESVLKSVTEWGPSIVFVKDELITYDLCKIAIKNHDGAICSIKPYLLTKKQYYKLCLLAVSENGWNLKIIPKDMQTQELCDTAIKRSCWAYKYVQQEFKTPENSLSAVTRNGQIMEYVPKEFIDKEMCEAAAKSRYPCLNHIPKEFLTQEICEIAVKADGENVKWVPDEFMSISLAYLAINSPAPSHPSTDMCASNIQYIKGKFLTKEIIVNSAKRWFSTYSRIPKECLSDEIEDAVLEVSPYCIKHMKQTPERCLKAIKLCPYTIETQIEYENITKEMAEYILLLDDKIKNRIDENTLKDLRKLL